MDATFKRQHYEPCRLSAIVILLTLSVVLLIVSGFGCSERQSSARNESVNSPVTRPRIIVDPTKYNAKFDVSFEEYNGVRLCLVTFSGKLPSPDVVDKILLQAIEKGAQEKPSQDILATALLGDTDLDEHQYSGQLVYKASQGKIMTMDESEGVKTSTSSTSAYFVQIEEQHTHAGVTPSRSWLSLTVVFPKAPSQAAAYQAMLSEIQKVTERGLDVYAYVSVGNKAVKTSWYQMRDKDGAFIFAHYEAATKKIERDGKVLKEL